MTIPQLKAVLKFTTMVDGAPFVTEIVSTQHEQQSEYYMYQLFFTLLSWVLLFLSFYRVCSSGRGGLLFFHSFCFCFAIISATLFGCRVICSQLGFTGGRMSCCASGGSGIVWMSDVDCSGSEDSISRCYHRAGLGENTCQHSDDVYLECDSRGTGTTSGLSNMNRVYKGFFLNRRISIV